MLWLVGGMTATSIRYHLRKVSDRASFRSKARPNEPVEILAEVTRIVWLMEAQGEIVEEGVVIRLVAGLQRIDQDQGAAGLQHAADLLDNGAAGARRQLVEK